MCESVWVLASWCVEFMSLPAEKNEGDKRGDRFEDVCYVGNILIDKSGWMEVKYHRALSPVGKFVIHKHKCRKGSARVSGGNRCVCLIM